MVCPRKADSPRRPGAHQQTRPDENVRASRFDQASRTIAATISPGILRSDRLRSFLHRRPRNAGIPRSKNPPKRPASSARPTSPSPRRTDRTRTPTSQFCSTWNFSQKICTNRNWIGPADGTCRPDEDSTRGARNHFCHVQNSTRGGGAARSTNDRPESIVEIHSKRASAGSVQPTGTASTGGFQSQL